MPDQIPTISGAIQRAVAPVYQLSLFAREDGTLFGYLETEDFDKSLAAMDGLDVNTRWQATMVPYFEQLEGKRPDESFLCLEEVFHLD